MTSTAPAPTAQLPYRINLEAAICDLCNATVVLETVAETAIGDIDQHEKVVKEVLPNLGGYRVFVLTEEQTDALDYILHHVGDLARALRRQFYGDAEAEETSS